MNKTNQIDPLEFDDAASEEEITYVAFSNNIETKQKNTSPADSPPLDNPPSNNLPANGEPAKNAHDDDSEWEDAQIRLEWIGHKNAVKHQAGQKPDIDPPSKNFPDSPDSELQAKREVDDLDALLAELESISPKPSPISASKLPFEKFEAAAG